MNLWFLAAGGLALAWTAMHLFAGGPSVARPLLVAKDIPDMPKYVNYYCWHLVSFNLAMMAGLFLWAGLTDTGTALAVAGTIQAAFYWLWGVVLPPWKGQSYAQMPQGWLFLPIVILGGLGVIA